MEFITLFFHSLLLRPFTKPLRERKVLGMMIVLVIIELSEVRTVVYSSTHGCGGVIIK
jgi:hypothetical protein